MPSRDTDTDMQRRPSNRVLVLFGATGDLAKRKLFPGFYHLFRAGLMPEEFRIIGSGRHSSGSDEDFREHVHEALGEFGRMELDDSWEEFASRLSFVVSDADDGSELAAADAGGRGRDRRRRESGSSTCRCPQGRWRRWCGCSARRGSPRTPRSSSRSRSGTTWRARERSTRALHEVLEEESIYRIDHFLGKEAAQNILALRFANGIFEPVWNRDHISYVQIDVPEKIDIQGRAELL